MYHRELKILCQVYKEMNSIRARDGAPHGVSEEWWDELTESVNQIVIFHTGKSAWLNPILFTDNPPKESGE